MSPLIPRLFAVLLLCHAAGHALAGAVPTTPPPAEAFFENANFTDHKLSPDGRYLAARTSRPGERYRLTVVQLDDLSVKVVAMFSDADVANFDWVNDQRLVFDTADKSSTRSDDRYAPGLFAVNRDGSAYQQLAKTTYDDSEASGSRIESRALDWNHYLLGQHGLQNSDSVYVVSAVFSPNYRESRSLKLGLLNTLTGRLTRSRGRATSSAGSSTRTASRASRWSKPAKWRPSTTSTATATRPAGASCPNSTPTRARAKTAPIRSVSPRMAASTSAPAMTPAIRPCSATT